MTRRAALPPEIVPFPVADRYLVRPDLTRLGATPAHVTDAGAPTLVRLDAGAPRALAHALRELAEAPEDVRWIDPDVPAATWARWARGIAAALVAEGDPRVEVDDHGELRLPWLGVRVGPDGVLARGAPADATPAALAALAGDAGDALARLANPRGARGAAAAEAAPTLGAPQCAPAAVAFDALRLALAEDMVVVRRARPGDGGAAAFLSVTAASGWDPGRRGRASFADLHGPVPRSEALLRAGPAIVDAMVDKGPFVRYVWSLAADDALSHHPRRHPPAPLPPDPSGWWLRVERQTTLGLPPDGAAFLIRVQHAPLAATLTTAARRAALAAAVRGMDDALLAYKGLAARRDELLAWLDAGDAD